MKSLPLLLPARAPACRSREGAWIEIFGKNNKRRGAIVAPARERGLKYDGLAATLDLAVGRSREGAWIEMLGSNSHFHNGPVAPARERGLKFVQAVYFGHNA